MRKFKRLLTFIMVLAGAFCIYACGGGTDSNSAGNSSADSINNNSTASESVASPEEVFLPEIEFDD